MQARTVTTYIVFNGCCEEALAFYKKHLDAEIIQLMRYKDAPKEEMRGPAEQAEKIAHVEFKIGDTLLMAADDCADKLPPFSGFSLGTGGKDVASSEKIFHALAQDGNITMPWQKTFWSEGFGMLVDKFGIRWMVSSPDEQN